MKKLLIILFMVLPLVAVGKIDYVERLATVPGLEEFPNAYAINVFTEVEIDIHEDNSYDKHVSYLKKILTYKGKKEYSDISIVYNADYETLELGECYSVSANGEKIPLPKEALHDSEHYLTVQSPNYVNLRETVVNMPAVEPGYSVVVNYTIHNERKDYIGGIEHLMEENPYLEKNFTISLPENKDLYYDFPNDVPQLDFYTEKQNGKHSYNWQIINSDFIISENNSPSLLITGCPIIYSTAKDWQELGALLKNEFFSNFNVTKPISQKTDELLEDVQEEKEKIQILYNYLAENYVIKPANLQSQSFVPQKLELSFSQQYGTARDLVALFIGMATHAGIGNIYPAIILNENDKISSTQENNAIRDFFTDLTVYWRGNLLRIGDGKMPFMFAGVKEANVVVLNEPIDFIEYSYDSEYFVERKITCQLESQGNSVISYNNIYRGKNDYEYRKIYKDESSQKRMIWFAQQMSSKSAFLSKEPEFINIDKLEKPLQIKYETQNTNFYIEQNDYLYFKLPADDVPLQVSQKDRTTPFQNYESYKSKEVFIIEGLPENYELLKPADNKKTYKNFEYKLNVETQQDKLIITKIINFPQAIISVQDYPDLKEYISSLQQPLNLMVFIKKQ